MESAKLEEEVREVLPTLPRRILPYLASSFVFFIVACLVLSSSLQRSSSSLSISTIPEYIQTSSTIEASREHEAQQRFLQDIVLNLDPDPAVNDDITRDATCKHYMSKFLNGTTDFNDICQGINNAYKAADCVEDTHTVIMMDAARKKKHHHHNDSNDDDAMIDDFYEQWRCCSSIYQYYTTHCHEPELDSVRLLGIVSVLVLCSMVKSLFHQVCGLEWLPDVAIYVLVGAVAGGFLRVVAPDIVAERLTFNNDLFLHILLPPIIFQAALKIDKRSFRRDLFPILSFAVLGTVVSSVAVGFITYYMTRLGPGTQLPLLDSMLFGSLISSIDPVATLGILSTVGASQRDTLYTIIFGEGMVNDAVAIVLFDTFIEHLGDKTAVGKTTAMEMLRYFTGISLGSMAIGIVCGGCCTIYFYNTFTRHSAVTEVALFFSFALIPYYLSDLLGGSGIIAIMTMGFFLDYYVIGGNQSEEGEWMDFMQLRCNNDRARSEGDLAGVAPEEDEPTWWDHWKLSWSRAFSGRGHILTKSRGHVGFVAEVIADIMETAIFAYLGLFLFNSGSTGSQWDWKLNGIAIFGVVLSRLGMIAAISGLINAFVFCDVEGAACRCFHRMFADLCRGQPQQNLTQSARTTMSAPLLSSGYDDPPTGDEEDDEDDDDPESSVNKRFLDIKTQFMLLLAGVRGAVSFALVVNVPLYNTVTKRGSQYKAELKAMTSSSIIFTLFVFGAITYFIVRKDQADPNRERIAGNFTHRLMSMPLASDNEGEDDSDFIVPDPDTMLLEMETEVARPRRARFRST